jgi:hypothetical protein
MHPDITTYNNAQNSEDQAICNLLASIIDKVLAEAESKVWHAHPVWFLDENPIVGYSRQKAGLRLMFWSGADFEEKELNVIGKKFKDASIFYQSAAEIDERKLKTWLKKSKSIQWDYKNIMKRKGRLEKIG